MSENEEKKVRLELTCTNTKMLSLDWELNQVTY